jgi:hypothetical protein
LTASGVTTSVPVDDASIVPPTRLLGLTEFKCRRRAWPKLGRVRFYLRREASSTSRPRRGHGVADAHRHHNIPTLP